MRDPAKAIQLAQRAASEVPENATYRNTLGVAHYRAGDWQASIESLTEAIRLRKDGNARDHLFLGMAYWRLEEPEKAVENYQLGRTWMDTNRPGSMELRRIDREAKELLNIEGQGD